jgi:heavy metal sensor kinase
LSFDPRQVPAAGLVPKARQSVDRTQPVAGASDLLISSTWGRSAAGVDYLVEVGGSAGPVDALFRHLVWLFAMALPAVVLLGLIGGYLLVGNALVPVEGITQKAELISQHNLSERLPVASTGDELERLSVSLNRMIGRLDDAFQSSKRFVADASHELRTPLTILRGEMEELAADPALSAPHREQVGSLLEEVERLTKIVERLFALSRLDAGEAQAEWVRFDLAEMAAATAGQMELLAEDRRIALSTHTNGPVLIAGDRSRLKQVVVNLLDNAIKYTPEGGAVALTIEAQGSQAVLEVSDTGVGIDPADLGFVFERFYRTDKSRSRNPDGAGLGLAIVKSICHANRGDVTVTSVVGQGSKFQVRFPLVDAAPV